jgi:transposase
MNGANTQPRLDWREGRRRRAWELKQQGWKQTAIAAVLGVTPGAVSQWLKRVREHGVEALRRHPAPGPTAKLTADQVAQLAILLARGPEAYGFRGQRWTCKRVAEVIWHTFGVRYHPAHVNRLLHTLQHSVQRPIARAAQRDERTIQAWWQERWPALEKKRPTKGAPSSG